MKLFTLGPVEMYESTKKISQKDFVYFRTEEYSDIVNNSLKKLAKLIGVSGENSVIYMALSGTGAMEGSVENCINKNEKALVINGGTFGYRFCQLLEYHGIPYSSIDLKWNETLTQKHLDLYNNKNFTHLFVNICETQTGQLYDIKMLSDFCKQNNMYLIVDAIGSFLADEYCMDKYGIDLTIISSQKGLCLSSGMAIVAFSERMKEKVLNNKNKISSVYFDFKDYLKNIERGQTPYTPTIGIMYELSDMLNLIDKEGGKEVWISKVQQKCDYFREKAVNFGLSIPEYPKSNMLTPVYFNNVNAYEIFKKLKDKFQIYVNPCGGELADKIFRISHIGNTTIEDIDNLLEKIEICIKELQEGVYV